MPPWTRSPVVEHMLHADPPDHTRLRRLVNKAFTPRAVARLRPAIEEITDDLLDAMGDAGRADLIDALAFPLPIAVISEMLGVPHTDRDRVREWSRALISIDDPEAQHRAGLAFGGYLTELVDDKRLTPGQDMLSGLISTSDGGDHLTTHEVITMAFLLLVAGHETTVSLIGNAVYSLLRHPEQMRLLRCDRSLLPGAVEEVLRYESPVHIATLRFTTAPVVIGGVEIPPHELVQISLPAANRDASQFPDPDRFDIARDTRGHLAFGHGIHYCVGAPLARMEGEIALGKLLDRYPQLDLDAREPEVRWRPSLLVHGLRTLPITYSR
jgi:cytochrome P450